MPDNNLGYKLLLTWRNGSGEPTVVEAHPHKFSTFALYLPNDVDPPREDSPVYLIDLGVFPPKINRYIVTEISKSIGNTLIACRSADIIPTP